MIRRLSLVATLVFGLLGLVPGIASAAPACGDTIMHNTTLHADLDCTALTSGTGLTFGKPGLVLDLNGHTILGHVGVDTATGVYTDMNNDTIENGTIQNFGAYQIDVYEANHTVVTHVHLIGDGSNSSEGIYTEYGGADVYRHITSDMNYYGLDFYGSGGNLVSHNKITNAYYGVYTEYETADRFVKNVSVGNQYGFYDDYGNRVLWRANTANANFDGLYIDCDSYGPARIIGNVANQNSDDGIYAYECFWDVGSSAEATLIKGNLANSNGSYGIDAEDPFAYSIIGNTTNKNSDTGLYIEDNYGYYQVNNVANNTANNNSYYGIYADYFVPFSSGNSAGGNPTQNCFNIVCS
jgi:hypothetical protein